MNTIIKCDFCTICRMVEVLTLVEWKCVSMELGVLFVMTFGTTRMQV